MNESTYINLFFDIKANIGMRSKIEDYISRFILNKAIPLFNITFLFLVIGLFERVGFRILEIFFHRVRVGFRVDEIDLSSSNWHQIVISCRVRVQHDLWRNMLHTDQFQFHPII